MNKELDFFKGFTRENDIFDRVKFYESLMKVIKNSPEKNLVFSLDDRWGQGKTSFVKMMAGDIKANHNPEFNVIYFDAYENDYYSDPFIPVVAEFHSLFSDPSSALTTYKDSFLSVAKRVGAAALIGTLKAVITTSTASMIDGAKLVDSVADSVKNTSENLSDSLESYVEKKITSAKEEKQDIFAFRETLSNIHIESKKKTVFIIDELDRAKPDFSLDLLEKIKHLFSVEGVIFILVMNRGQFEKSIEKRYGGIDSKTYLNKFINYFISLPKTRKSDIPYHDTSTKTTIYKYIQQIPEAGKLFDYGSLFHASLSYLIEVNNCSLREAERCISLMNLFSDSAGKLNYNKNYATALIILLFLKVYDSTLYEKFISQQTNSVEILKELNLDVEAPSTATYERIHGLMKNLIEFHHLTQKDFDEKSDEIAKKYPDLHSYNTYPTNPFLDLKGGLENFTSN